MTTAAFSVGDRVVIREYTMEEKQDQLKRRGEDRHCVRMLAPHHLSGCTLVVDEILRYGYVLRPECDRSKKALKLTKFAALQDDDLFTAPVPPPQSTEPIAPGDLRPYAVPVPVRVISVSAFIAEVEFPDGHHESVDVAYLGGKYQEVE